MYLKVEIEGMGGTIYIVEEDHDMHGERKYIAEVSFGKDCLAKNKQEAVRLAQEIVATWNNFQFQKELG